jgi:NitT/TauT family transport system substrate-binding protein
MRPACTLVLALVLGVAACAPVVAPAAPAPSAPAPTAAPPRATVRAGYARVYSLAPTFIAKERGYFDAQHLDVQLELINSGPDGFAATVAGHLDVTITSVAAAVLNAWARGVDTRMLLTEAAYLPNGPAGSALVVRKELRDTGQVATPADLRGRKVALAALGTSQEWHLDQALKTGGLRATDVDLVLMPIPDTLPALGNAAVDGALALEPLASEAIERGYAVALSTDFSHGAQATVVIANGTWLKERRDVATRYVVAYLQAVRDLYGDGWRRDDNVAIIAEWTRLPAATIKRVLPLYADPDGVINVASLEAQQAFHAERGYLRYTTPLDLRAFLDDGPRAAAVSLLGPFRR